MGAIEVSDKLISFLIFLPLFFVSIAVHEFAHAFTAAKYGDDTAKKLGRMTLNPLKHLDLIGSLVMPLISFASGFLIIGWAKPVPVNRKKFKDPLKHDAIVTAAGPVSNFIMAVFFFIILLVLQKSGYANSGITANIFWMAVYFNIFLFAFNLLPIPPLDGSHILFDLFPNKYTAKLLSLSSYGMIIMLVFIFSPLWGYFIKFIDLIARMFVTISGY